MLRFCWEKNIPVAEHNCLSGKEVRLNFAKIQRSATVNSKTQLPGTSKYIVPFFN